MAPNNNIKTFNDIGSDPDRSVARSNAFSGAQQQSPASLNCFHIPSLPSADEAKALLNRVVAEFEPIVKRRGYNVASVSELCCCNDGLDFQPNRRRKLRKMANDVWGYNQTTQGRGKKSHTIHLRLRHPTDHARFLLYEDVAGTMAHELAHCEHGPHNEKFYKLMDGILEEHAVIMASKLTSNGNPMPAFGGNGQRLGGNVSSAAGTIHRQQPQLVHQGYKLGGDNAFQQWMTPQEAAAVAAEARRRQKQLRLRGDRCCRPCVIEIRDDDEEEDKEDETKKSRVTKDRSKRPKRSEQEDDRKMPAAGRKKDEPAVIDLSHDSDDESPSTKTKTAATTLKNPYAKQAVAPWSCRLCTFRNEALDSTCVMCQTRR